MCIWDRLTRVSLQRTENAFTPTVDVTRPVEPAVPQRNPPHGMKAYAVRASLQAEFFVHEELTTDARVMAMLERSARESLAVLLYDDVLQRLARIEQEVSRAADMDYRAADTVLPMIADLRDYMTRDEARRCM